MQLTTATAEAIAAALVATDGVFDPAATWMGVGTAISPDGQNTVLADITQATGAMATRKTITAWSGPYQLEDGSIVYQSPLKTWAPASTSEAQTLVCWFLVDAATSGNLLAYGLIQPSVVLSGPLNSWSIVLRFLIDTAGNWSTEVTFNG